MYERFLIRCKFLSEILLVANFLSRFLPALFLFIYLFINFSFLEFPTFKFRQAFPTQSTWEHKPMSDMVSLIYRDSEFVFESGFQICLILSNLAFYLLFFSLS